MVDINTTAGRPRVLVLSFSPIERDPRVLRQISVLGKTAEVMSCGYGKSPEGVVEHIEIPDDLQPWRPSYKKVVLLSLLGLHKRLYFGSKKVRFVTDRIPAGSVDVIIANDAIAAPLAHALRPRKGVHADLHEYAPRQGEDRLRWRVLVGPFMNWACRRYVTKAHSTSTVAKGIAEEYAKVYGICEPAVVPNAAPYESQLRPTPVGAPLRIVHTGAAGRSRRIEVMIDAIAMANEQKPGTATLDVVLVPGEQRYIEELQVKARSIPGDTVRVLPPVTFDQIIPMLHGYDVGLFLCPPTTFNLKHALPNKLFEFIQARLAVVIGPSPEMERVVKKYGVGWVADGFDAEPTAKLLLSVTAEQVAEMKQASHAASSELGAEKLSAPWTEAVTNLLEPV